MRDTFMYAAGLGFLTLAKAKNVLQGYTSPKTFDLSNTERAVQYDIKVVDEWLQYLKAYCGDDNVLHKNILELGPGSDLGVGVYLLSKGAATYNAMDVNELMKSAPEAFYSKLLERIAAMPGAIDSETLRAQLRAARAGEESSLKLVVRPDFDLTAAFAPGSIDLVFSQAAFEHFDDVAATIGQLSTVCRSGATIAAVIDLKTHSRWIRVKDPNNNYRYSDREYRSFWFRGAPNRVRPYQYRQLFERHGWADVSITPIEKIQDGRHRTNNVAKQFVDSRNQLDYLSVVLCAKKL